MTAHIDRKQTAPEIPPDEVRAQLDRILAAKGFARSPTLRRFLAHVVSASLDGRQNELKEYSIGIHVFGRGERFDPRLDAIVRVQAGKLRQRLDEYFRTAGVSDPIRIELPVGGYAPVFRRSEERAEPAESGVPTLAVLPFLNLSGDPDFEYFTDGLSEELISQLGRIRALRVIARTSAFAFKNQSLGLPEIGKKLGAKLLLEGSVLKSADKVRVTARLAEAASSKPLWSRRFDGELQDIFAVQDSLGAAIAETVRGEAIKPPRRPARFDSHLLLLRAWRLWRRNDPVFLQKALQTFQKAVQLDAANYEAQAGLSLAWTILGVFYAVPSSVAAENAEAAARTAVEHGPESAEAWGALGAALATLRWNWAEAERAFRRAIALNPSCVSARHGYAMAFLMPLRRFDDCLAEMKIVLELDPLSVMANCDLGSLHAYAGRHDDALRQYDATLELEPGNIRAIGEKGWTCVNAGRTDEGVALLEAAFEASPDNPFTETFLPLALALAGRREEALERITEIRKRNAGGRLVSNFPIFALDILGRREEALDELEAAYDRRDPHLRMINVSQHAARLRDEPRFQAVLRKIGIG